MTTAHVRAAARRISGVAVRTPLLHAPMLDERCGCAVYVKAECLQHTGSFKFRGAYNRLATLTDRESRRGVVAWSSGNHAQGVAAAAALLDVEATIVMPSDAPRTKIEGTQRHGAKIVFYDRRTEDRETIAHALARKAGATIVPSFDDPLIIAGQGTLAAEIIAELDGLSIEPDVFLAPCGGGGLIAGCATLLAARWPGTRIYAVEPKHFDDTTRSLAVGRRERNPPCGSSICDALLADQPGRITFPINRRLLTGGLTVTDEEVIAAVQVAFRHLKLVVEPSGAVALAAALSRRIPGEPQLVVVVVSGGNVDPLPYSEMVSLA